MAPPNAIAADLGWRTKVSAVHPLREGRRDGGESSGDLAEAARCMPLDSALEVVRYQSDQQPDDDGDPSEGRWDEGAGQGCVAGEHVGSEQDAEDHQRGEIDGVEDHEEGDHPADRLACLHAGLPQGPVAEQDPAGTPGGEQPGRRQAGHRDLVALVPLQVDHLLADDAPEKRDVGGEHADAEDDPESDP
jgi:hypothetical protein